MSFKLLLSAIESGNKDEAKKLASSLETDFNLSIKEIEKFEVRANDAVSHRDKLKHKMREVSKKLGVDELTVEVLEQLEHKNGNNSEIEAKYKQEIEKLAKQIEDNDTSYNTKLKDAHSRYQDAIIDKELIKLGATANVADGAMEDVVRYLKSNATIENGKLVYMKDGVAERNDKGRPIDISEKIESLKTSNSYLFNKTMENGSGEPHRNRNGSVKKFSEMTSGELVELRKTNLPEYERLKNEHYGDK